MQRKGSVTSSMSNFYTFLNISDSASQAEIEAAYQHIMGIVHQRIAAGDPPTPETFAQVEEAFNVLRDPVLRARYDMARLQSGFAEQITVPADKPLKVAVKQHQRKRTALVTSAALVLAALAAAIFFGA